MTQSSGYEDQVRTVGSRPSAVSQLDSPAWTISSARTHGTSPRSAAASTPSAARRSTAFTDTQYSYSDVPDQLDR
jgi:hypothetical protein